MADNNINLNNFSNILTFPRPTFEPENLSLQTPLVDKEEKVSQKLNDLSNYKSEFDWEPIRKLEVRAAKNPIRGGLFFKTPFKLVNSHATCQQCLYAFEVDTYGRGCVHNCVYCYAKDQLTSHGYWNRPYPVPVNINSIRKVFYSVFETDKKSRWRSVMESRIPIRIGSMSDSFMWMDEKMGVTKEFLKILNFYNYPYIIFTRSDLVAREDYMSLLDPKLCSVQFSISSLNDHLNKKIEPGAPSAKRRLKALEKLNRSGIWTTVRLNPFFPMYPDGYFTNKNFSWEGKVPKFDFSTFDMVDQIAAHGVPSILAGVVRLSAYSINQIEKAADFNFRQFFTLGNSKSTKDFHYSDKEIRYYYEQIRKKCMLNSVQFTTCYIGNGEGHFWKDQDLWSNKKDCCNVKNRVPTFKNDCRQIDFDTRKKFGNKYDTPIDEERLHEQLGGVKKNDSLIKTKEIFPVLGQN